MATTLTLAQLAIASQLVDLLQPLPTNSAIAVCGNVAQECGFDPNAAGDGGVSKYWMQWQGARLTNYLAWCTSNHFIPTSPQAIGFFNYELPMPDGAPLIVPWLMDTSNNGQPTRSLATLTADVCQFYERAGTPDLDSRISYAEQVAAHLGPAPTPAPTPTPTPTPTPIPVPTPNPVVLDPTVVALIDAIIAALLKAAVVGLL